MLQSLQKYKCRFQKRLQLNLLQLVDSVSIQFKSTKENPDTIYLSSDSTKLSKQKSEVLINPNKNNNDTTEILDESKFRRRNRSSFTDMPKI